MTNLLKTILKSAISKEIYQKQKGLIKTLKGNWVRRQKEDYFVHSVDEKDDKIEISIKKDSKNRAKISLRKFLSKKVEVLKDE